MSFSEAACVFVVFYVVAPLLSWSLVGFAIPDVRSVSMLIGYIIFSVLTYKSPAGKFYGPETEGGKIHSYPHNCILHVVASVSLLFLGDCNGIWSASVVVETLPKNLLPLNAVALCLCTHLFVQGCKKGVPPDDGTTSAGLFRDFYNGVWLHPKLFGMDVKLLINSRIGMMLWFLHNISSCVHATRLRDTDYGLLFCSVSQIQYLLLFFWTEDNYANTIDIMYDRGGFYELWGCLCFVPAFYTIHTRRAIEYGSGLALSSALPVYVIGSVAWFLCQWTNEQKRLFRINPERTICCSRDAPRKVEAFYYKDGELRSNYLLTGGWWGQCRHPQYVFDILHSFSWGVLAGGFNGNVSAFLYPVYITVLLVHRSIRDEKRCRLKYGTFYETYKETVPYRMIRYIW